MNVPSDQVLSLAAADKKVDEDAEDDETPATAGKPVKFRRPLSRHELLKNAAKMRIRRMIKRKKHRTDLEVPAMVREQWEKGTNEKNELAALLMSVNWDKDQFVAQVELVVKKKMKVKITRNEGWFSELELKNELKWTTTKIQGVKKVCEQTPKTHIRSNRYDGALEYWVVTKETAEHTESQSMEELHKSKKQVESGPTIEPGAFSLVDEHLERDKLTAAPGASDSVVSEVEQRAVLKRYVDSVLAKMNKLKSLLRDLKKNYADDPSVPIKSLEENLAKMDEQYESLNEHVAVGESIVDKVVEGS